MNHIIEAITSYKTKSADPIRDQQVAYIPRLANDMIDYVAPCYYLNGNRVIPNITNQMFVKLKYLKFIPTDPRKLLNYRNGIFSMSDLAKNKIIMPFMVFINGYFVPWEFTDIVIDSGHYYIVFNGEFDIYYANLFKGCDYIQIVMLPEYVEYINDYTGNSYDAMFGFNNKGRYDIDDMIYAFVPNNLNYRMVYNYWHTTSDVNGFAMLNQTDIKITNENVILFVNGKFSTGSVVKVRRAMDDSYKREDGRITPCLDFTFSPDIVAPNPIVTVESSLITINGGHNYNRDEYDFALFINPNYTTSIDNISYTDLEGLSQIVSSKNMSGIVPEYFDDLTTPFELRMSTSKNYNDNLSDAIKTVMEYNTSLFNPVLKKKSNLVIEEHDGEWVYANMTGEGTIRIPIAHSSMIDEYIVVLVNGELYKHHSLCNYKTNMFIMPVGDINYDDTIELLRFKNVNNYETSIVINENDGFVPYHESVINDAMSLYCKEYNGAVYTYPNDGLQHFEIDYTLEKDSAGRIKIVLDDPFYYGKILTLAYKNRFKHFTFNLEEDAEYAEYIFNLEDKFMYCPEYSRYMVFLNGRRLYSNHYRLVLPVRPTTPFSDFKIYLTLPIKSGDKLDIIYTPSLMQDVVINNTLSTSGDIAIDKSVLDYGFSTELYMVWVNGKKIPISHIADINSTTLRVISDEKSTDTLCITKYIPSIDIFNDVFDENTALWDSITSKMSVSEINTLLGISGTTISNTEPSTYDGAAGIKMIMNELIRDEFITNPRVEITGPFVYDYLDVDTTIVSGQDSGGNATLITSDANHDDNLAIIEREKQYYT